MCVERRFFLKAIIVIVAFGFVCNFVKPGLIQASSGKTITIAQGVDMTSWDPHGRATTSALAMWYHMYERLVKQDVIKGTYIPLLAESWTGEGTVWTFKLRKGVKFHNGAEFTANDVKFTIEHALKAPMGARLRGIKGAEVVDKHTVKIITHKPHSPLLGLVRFVVILSEQHFKENGKDALKKPVGTGPFQFVKWVKGSHFIAKKNPAYWGKPAQIDQIIWRPIPEDAARITALETGAVDLATNIPSHDLARLEKDPNIRIERMRAFRVMEICLNQSFEPFKNRKVRQAVSYAVDVESLIKHVLDGMAYPVTTLGSPGTMGYDPAAKPYPYDPAKAKSLLAEAGYPNGFEVDFYSPTGRYPKDRELAQAIGAQLAKVGIKAKVHTPEWGIFVPGVRKGKFPMFYYSGFTLMDPDIFLKIYFYSKYAKMLKYSNPEVDKLLGKQAMEFDPAKREMILRKLIKTIVDDVPLVLLYHHQSLYGVTERLKWKPLPSETILMHDAWVR